MPHQKDARNVIQDYQIPKEPNTSENKPKESRSKCNYATSYSESNNHNVTKLLNQLNPLSNHDKPTLNVSV